MRKLLLISIIVVLSSCNFSDETRSLSGDWTFVDEGHLNRVIDGGKNHIPCDVIKYGYNNDFIIAAQKPTEDCFLGKDTSVYKAGKNKTYYWIIGHSQKLFLGPMNETEFNEAKKKYNVPDDLELKPVY